MKEIFYIIIIVFLLFSLTPYSAYAAQNLTLEECISLALKNNESLKASLTDIEMRKQETRMSYSEKLPKFSSEFQFTLFDREPSFIIEENAFSAGVPSSNVELPAGERDIYEFTLKIKQPIFTGGYLTNAYKSARIQEKAAEINSENVRNEIILKVKLAYYNLLKTLKTKETQEKILQYKKERRRVVEERQKEGVSNREELLLAKSEMAMQELELFKTENDLNIKEEILKNLIGIDHDVKITLADRLENKRLLIELPESKDIALKNRRDLAISNYMIKISEREIEIAESSFYPKSAIVGSYTRQKETPLSNPDLWALMFTIDWNIFEWDRTKADVRRAEAKYEKLNTEHELLKKDVMIDVEEKWFKVKETEKEVEVAKEKYVHAEEYYKNAALKYKEKLIKTAELLEAETYLIQNRNKYITSIYDLNKALAEFEFSISSNIDRFIVIESIKLPQVEFINTEQGTEQSQEVIQSKEALLKTPAMEDNKYVIQVGAFKRAEYAQELLKRLKTYYPDVYIFVTDGFNKVRIPGIRTKKEGVILIKEMRKKFKLRPFLLRAH